MPKLRVVTLSNETGRRIGREIQEKLRTPIAGLPPQGKNTTRTDADDALAQSLPRMQAYPHENNISGNGGGPIIGREPRELSQ